MPLSPLRPGDPVAIGGFQLVARLGAGGMGVVYVGSDQAGRPAAVKAVKAEHAADPRFRARFRREVAAARAVTGTCTARVLDADPDADEPWLATEYVGGASLSDVVHADGPLTGDLLHPLAAGLAEALCAIHTAGVVHRDLKPANVLLAPDGPKVIDFGIAALESATLATGTGVGMGSPGYMAPEQITGTTTIGPPADVYAWGLTVLFAATGRSPFGTGPAQALMYRAVAAEVDMTGAPAWIEPLLRAALEREPADRPTAQQVLGWLVESGTQPLRVTGAEHSSPRRRARMTDGETPTPTPRTPIPAAGAAGMANTDAAGEPLATELVLRREWRQPAAAQAPALPSQPLIATGSGPVHPVSATRIATPGFPGDPSLHGDPGLRDNHENRGGRGNHTGYGTHDSQPGHPDYGPHAGRTGRAAPSNHDHQTGHHPLGHRNDHDTSTPAARNRVPLIVGGAAAFVVAALAAWVLLSPDDPGTGNGGAAAAAGSTAATPTSAAATGTAQASSTSSPEATTESPTETTTTQAPAAGTVTDVDGIPSYSGEIGDLDLATSFGSFIVGNHDQVVHIDAQAPDSDHTDRYFVEHPENSDYDEPHFTLFECNGLEDGQEPGLPPDAPCAATTYLIDLDDDSQASFDFSGGSYRLEGYFEVDADEGTQNGATVVKLSGLDADDVDDARDDGA
ncbi:serine/threonine protein kinase [Kineosporia sp. J2-2]|uniref:Serine/threonine protein kinase n=1 Tax=Kineosporia corallincola TaxID=2835133 RepID=A0ABS5TP66_9ACTN|nr:serine/threonine-protein kinase [Kineosporia corallincola]MBT0771986.1 serine/threonine protein kinase [Kineosporia corallincola]